MNQPTPLALWSIGVVPALGVPLALKLVMVASASCPGGRSVIWKLMSSGVEGLRWFDQI